MIKKLFWVFLLLSLLVHLGSYWLSLSLRPDAPERLSTPKAVEFEIIETPTPNPHESAPLRFAEAPKELLDDSLEALRKKAQTLSEKVQRVKKEMQAELFGQTANRWQAAQAKLSDSKARTPPPQASPTNPNGDFIDQKNERTSSETNPLNQAPSTFGNQLNRNVEVGQFTALNTDRHLYYSFYSRIEELIRPPWEDRIIMETRRLSGRPMAPKNGWTTRIDVVLNSSGQLDRVVLLKGSGIKSFDDAAIEAFYKANFFPHPPKEMINADGTIVLKYIFSVY